jgi:hypothetical protein
MHAESETSIRLGAQRCQAYLDSGVPFPERLHIIALMARFLTELADAYERWAAWAVGEVESWPDTKSAAGWDPSPTFRPVVDRAKGVAAAAARVNSPASTGDSEPRGFTHLDRHRSRRRRRYPWVAIG